MVIGVPRETKTDEYRVALATAGVRDLVDHGHDILVQRGAGIGSSIPDEEYRAHGAQIVADAAEVFATCDLIVKVKEPQPAEVTMLRSGQVLFTYLHLAADAVLTRRLADTGATCIAYETISDHGGRFPLLAPMSAIAGKIAVHAGAFMLGRTNGGRGTLLGGVPGVASGRVMVIGAGTVGENAARVAVGMGAKVYLYDRSLPRLAELEMALDARCTTCFASALEIESRLPEVDLIIGAVLVPGARAPRVITRAHLALMRPGAVMVDVSIDQGGCFETSRPTTHSSPTFAVDGISHYCVANMPGALPVTATAALTNATLPYVLALAEHGVGEALKREPGFLGGLSVAAGDVTSTVVADAHGMSCVPASEALEKLAGI